MLLSFEKVITLRKKEKIPMTVRKINNIIIFRKYRVVRTANNANKEILAYSDNKESSPVHNNIMLPNIMYI